MATLTEAPGIRTAAPPPSGQGNPSSRILVVDDDREVRHLNTKVLLRSGYLVDAAEDGAAAWEALRENKYDLLITDHKMPKMSGIELIEVLRSAHMALPVILVSGTLPTEELTRKPWLRLDAKLPKPYTCEVLLGLVKELLLGSESARDPFTPQGNCQSEPAGTVKSAQFRPQPGTGSPAR